MSKTVLHDGDEGVLLIVKDKKPKRDRPHETRSPVHVVYGGAHLFKADTPEKLGTIALRSLETYAPNLDEFVNAFGLNRAGKAIYQRVIEKLKTEPVEDLRIDFEDGYGFRSDEEEDSHAVAASNELAKAFLQQKTTAFSGFRIKSLAPATYGRAANTLNIFLDNLLERTGGELPQDFAVTLPKVTDTKEVRQLCQFLKRIEKKFGLTEGSINVELMIETPQSIIDKKGRIQLADLVKAAKGRCTSAHFGAYDYTSALGISAAYQSIDHEACVFARQMMLAALSPLGIRLSDSVTTEIPVPIHRTGRLSAQQKAENAAAVQAGWRTHFENVTRSMTNGFYQSWDLHPNQLVSRYAAVYSFFRNGTEPQAERLKTFIEKATQASLTGMIFDDAASAQGLMNFFTRGVGCGAFSANEVRKLTGLTTKELNSRSFQQIMDARRAAAAGS
jgi:citrate lyase beta subunit